MSPLIIAIDGPSGSGKTTLGRLLARALNLLYLDTGSMYRAVALATKPEHKALKAEWLAALTDIYKDFHNNTDAGLTELIATVLSKPMP